MLRVVDRRPKIFHNMHDHLALTVSLQLIVELFIVPSPINTSTLQIVGAILTCGLSEAIEAFF